MESAESSTVRSKSRGALPPSLLIVDDDCLTLEMLGLSLNDTGFKVHTASNVASALEIARKNPISVVITDISLPDGSGIDLVGELEAYNVRKSIAVTGYSPDQKLRNAGFHAFLTKPIDLDNLKRTIDSVIES